ncbi:hypothetical protein [Idiomarina abyssalis]|uniref:hypothetical protein n=1 Tax=Idiomarina abyssalis TaxID=86102 RepID=UPI003A8D7346
MKKSTTPRPYVRAKCLLSVPAGSLLPTRSDYKILYLARYAKQARLTASRMPYRMRLAAMIAADNRPGTTWP